MKLGSKLFRLRGRKKSLILLFWAGWLLLGVSWGMSFYAYSRLPQETAQWLSLWKRDMAAVEKSWHFFIYPLAQTFFFLGFLLLAEIFFFKDDGSEKDGRLAEKEKKQPFQDLKRETVYLALIFVHLIFIHLQTTLILMSHRLSRGINVSYVIMLFAVIALLIPYYIVRRKMLLRER